jgi:hypothetical protein
MFAALPLIATLLHEKHIKSGMYSMEELSLHGIELPLNDFVSLGLGDFMMQKIFLKLLPLVSGRGQHFQAIAISTH